MRDAGLALLPGNHCVRLGGDDFGRRFGGDRDFPSQDLGWDVDSKR